MKERIAGELVGNGRRVVERLNEHLDVTEFYPNFRDAMLTLVAGVASGDAGAVRQSMHQLENLMMEAEFRLKDFEGTKSAVKYYEERNAESESLIRRLESRIQKLEQLKDKRTAKKRKTTYKAAHGDFEFADDPLDVSA